MAIGQIIATAGLAAAGVMGKSIIEKGAEKLVDGSGSSLLNVIGMLKQQWVAGAGQSLVSRSKSLRVEPYVLIDERCARLPYAKKLMQTAQQLFTPYYMLSVAADNRIGSLKVSQRLDKFSPDRDLHNASVQFLSVESYAHGLPFVGEAVGLDRYRGYSPEAAIPKVEKPADGDRSKQTGVGVGDVGKAAQEIQNLAVGAIVNLEIIDGNNRGTIPVQIRMRPMGIASTALSEILALGGEDNSRAARWQRVKVGDLSLIKDGIFNQDRIDRYREAVSSDKTGYYRKVHKRANRNKFATLMTGQPSIGEISTIAILSRETQMSAEGKMLGRLDDFATRQSIFDTGLMMMLMVVDDDNEVITVYTRDIDDVATYTFKDLESAKSSNDMTDLLKLLMEGRMPGRL